MRQHAAVRPFTLIELIMVMGVMLVLAAIAVPAYSSLFSGRKTTLAANMLNGAVMEARSHAVSSKAYTALIFVKDGGGYKSFRMAEVFKKPDENDDNTYTYEWRRWVTGTSFVLLPENTMIPATNNDLGKTSEDAGSEENVAGSDLPKVSNLSKSGISGNISSAPAIIFKPNGQLAGIGTSNVVVRFVETNRYEANAGQTPKLPLNINWLTCKTKFLDPVL